MSASKTVLITGTSSGIGAATALRLVKAGHVVYATARSTSTLGALQQAGCRVLALDVTDEASMVAAVRTVEGEAGRIDVLINNAGYSQSGALESVPLDKIRRQFETNVFGLIRMCQLVLPGMRARGSGHIVNIGSMGGRLTFPGGGVYHATKYAVEAISDALRVEVKNFGIKVVLVEPGLIKTGFGEAVATASEGLLKDPAYDAFNEVVVTTTREICDKGPLAPLSGVPEDVAAVIQSAIERSNPRARYPVTPSAHVLIAQRAWSPDWLWDAFVGASFVLPGRH
jgi:NADP-dependent 3-hydroxy acid dehydrogenase YdfG